MKLPTLTTVAVLLLAVTSKGQLMPMQESHSKSVYLKTGYNYSILATSAGFKKYFSGYRTAATAEVTQTLTAPGLHNLKLKAGTHSWFNVYQKLWLSPQLGLAWTRGQVKGADLESIGATIQLTTQLVFNRFSAGVDLFTNPVFATHFKHSADYRKYFFNDAKDGWYKSSSLYYGAGLNAGFFLDRSRTLELTAEGGVQRSGQYDQLIPNLYIQFGLCKRFN